MFMEDVLFDDDDEVAIMAVVQELANEQDEDDGMQRIRVDVQGWRELSNLTFKKHFRMDRIVFQNLIVTVGHHLVAQGRMRRLRTPLDLCLLMALWPIFNPDTFRSAGAHFGVDGKVIHFHYVYVIRALREMAPRFIKWPSALERDAIKADFERRYGYPGIVGCMDGVHIELTAPVEQPQRYINRHDCHSVLVQAVCDNKLLYRDIYVGEPGSIGDRRMFDRSPLSSNLLLRPNMLSRGEHIVADGAYTLTDKVIIPYIADRNNTPWQRTHNTILSRARSAVERSFALLKGKHRRHKKLPMRNHEYAIDHITSGFVLHNFILLDGQEANGLPSEAMPIADEVEFNALLEQAKAAGVLKREYIAHLLVR